MSRQEIQPQKVTRPFQLLAAWLVTLIALDGAFLTGARMVTEPPWISAMLSIAAVVNVPLFLLSMFLLQTRFRPEMQDDKYYANYLKERLETSQVAVKLTERMTASGLDIQSLVSAQRKLSDLPSEIKSLFADLRSHVSVEQQTAPKPSEPDPDTILALAKGFLAEQKWLEAAREFERYGRHRPYDWEASYGRGVAFANARGCDVTNLSALRAYNDAIVYAPQDGGWSFRTRLFAYRGAILKRLNRLEEAEADLCIAERHASTEPERIDVAYNLACLYALTRRRDEMLCQIRSIAQNREYLDAVRAHLHDYFATYSDDNELLSLIERV